MSTIIIIICTFLAVQNSSIGDLVTHSLTHSLTDSLRVLLLLTSKSDPRDLWPLRHLIRVMRRHDPTIFWQPWTFLKLFWNFFGTFLELIWNFFGTFLVLLWYFFGTSLELLWTLFGTFLEFLWNFFGPYLEIFLELLWNFFGTNAMTKTILETCDIWDTDYNSDNWEPEFMTIFATWQLRATLDSIRNSCDVYLQVQTFER